MKRTIKLLILLLIVVVGLFSYVNYTLANKFSAINQNDPFYEYQKHLDIDMKDIVIKGGNRLNVKIEKGETNSLFIHKRIAERVNFNTDNHTLLLEFDVNLTDSSQSSNHNTANNNAPKVIITYTDINHVWADNARLVMHCPIQKEMNINCEGNTLLLMNVNGSQEGQLNLDAEGKSRINIVQSELKNTIDLAKIALKDQSFLKLNQFRADSLNITMAALSRIDCDNHVFKQLSQSLVSQ